jgi:DNA-binding beta-propeller fold protein YncE
MERRAVLERFFLSFSQIILLSFLTALLVFEGSPAWAQGGTGRYEVWAADQNANMVFVLNAQGDVIRTLNVAESAKANRPHLLTPSRDGKLVFSANTASNSLGVHNAADGKVVAVVENVGKAPHAALPHPKDPNKVYVFNIGPRATDAQGKPDTGETIAEVIGQGQSWRVARTLDLKAADTLADDAKFPSRRPVLGGFSQDGRHLVVSFLNGGLAIVDVESWRVVRGIGNDQIHQYVTSVIPSPRGNELYVTAGNQQESWLYVLDVSGEPQLVASHNLSSFGRDAHGAAIDPIRGELWIAHRVSSTVTIHPLQGIRQSGARPEVMEAGGLAPDFIAISPDGKNAYVTLRGPKPAPTIPFALAGESAGVVVIDVPNRKVVKVVKLGDPQTGDFHGVMVLPVS